MSVTKLWYCFNPSNRKPMCGHGSLAEAEKEAQRLCVKEGCEVYVLEMVSCYHPEPVKDAVVDDYWKPMEVDRGVF